jgi:hypothetical protein
MDCSLGRLNLHYRILNNRADRLLVWPMVTALRISGDRYGLKLPFEQLLLRSVLLCRKSCLGCEAFSCHCATDYFLTLRQPAVFCNCCVSLPLRSATLQEYQLAPLTARGWAVEKRAPLLKSGHRPCRPGLKRAQLPLTAIRPRSVRPLMKNCTARATSKRPMMRTRMRIPDSPMIPWTRLAPLRIR